MSRRTIKPKKPNGHRKGNGLILSGVSKDSPFATLQNAVLVLASAQNQAQANARVQAIFDLVKSFEASFLEVARQVGAAERALVQLTGGEFHTVQFGGQLPIGTKIRVLDSEGTPATIVDANRGRFIKLPGHVDPMTIELTLPDGTVKTLTPGQPVVPFSGPVEEASS